MALLHTLSAAQVNLNSHPEPHELTYYGYYMTRYFGCPFANDEREGGGNSSGSQPRLLHPSLQLPQAPSSAAALGPLNIFSHLTGLEHLRELQVGLLLLSSALLCHDRTNMVLHTLCSAVLRAVCAHALLAAAGFAAVGTG
jgi:hypothetical protein